MSKGVGTKIKFFESVGVMALWLPGSNDTEMGT